MLTVWIYNDLMMEPMSSGLTCPCPSVSSGLVCPGTSGLQMMSGGCQTHVYNYPIKQHNMFDPYNAELIMENKGFFQFEIIINVLVSSFHFLNTY